MVVYLFRDELLAGPVSPVMRQISYVRERPTVSIRFFIFGETPYLVEGVVLLLKIALLAWYIPATFTFIEFGDERLESVMSLTLVTTRMMFPSSSKTGSRDRGSCPFGLRVWLLFSAFEHRRVPMREKPSFTRSLKLRRRTRAGSPRYRFVACFSHTFASPSVTQMQYMTTDDASRSLFISLRFPVYVRWFRDRLILNR